MWAGMPIPSQQFLPTLPLVTDFAATHSSSQPSAAAGRFAPSPTSTLHLGNLRTALAAWLLARSSGRRFVVRIEDLDQARVAAAGNIASAQLRDLEILGIDWDGPVVRQSERRDLYADAVAGLDTYPCFCTRKEIAAAATAPNEADWRPYPATCRGWIRSFGHGTCGHRHRVSPTWPHCWVSRPQPMRTPVSSLPPVVSVSPNRREQQD